MAKLGRSNYADWGDHELLVECVTRLDGVDTHLKKLNDKVAKNQEHLGNHCDRLTVLETKMTERTAYGWPSKKHLAGGATILLVFGTIAGTAIAKAIEFWPF